MTKTKPTGWQRALNAIGLQTDDQIETRIKKATRAAAIDAFAAGRRAAESDGGNDDPATGVFAAGGQGYKAATGQGEYTPSIDWATNLNTAQQLLESNPLAKRPSEIKRDYIVGQGVQPKAADPALQTIVDAFWTDNDMPRFISQLTKQLCDFGAQCVPAAVRNSDGRVRLGYIGPTLIERVIAHPENSKQMWAVVIASQRNTDPWANDTDVQVFRIIRKAEAVVTKPQRFQLRHKEGCEWATKNGESFPIDADVEICPQCETRVLINQGWRATAAKWHNPNDTNDPESTESTDGLLSTAAQCPKEPWELVMLDSYGLSDYTGDCFYERKNARTNQTLGRSDFLAVADYCDRHDDVLYSTLEKVAAAKWFMGIARIAGADDADIATWQAMFTTWYNETDGGGIFTVNESVLDIDMTAPSLSVTDDVSAVEVAQKLVLGGLGYPFAWFSAPGGAHLATLTAQGDPTWRTLKHDQGLVQAWFLQMLEFARDQAIIAGKYDPQPIVTTVTDGMASRVDKIEPDISITLPMPEMTVKDVTGLATALMTIVGAVDMAENAGLMEQENAIDLVAKVATELGINIDIDKLKEALVNNEQGGALGLGDDEEEEAALNLKSWGATHGALGDE